MFFDLFWDGSSAKELLIQISALLQKVSAKKGSLTEMTWPMKG